jgi:glycine hydroxymethyltransferase
MMESDMITIVEMIDRALVNAENEEMLHALRGEVNAFMKQFPLYAELPELV